MSIEMRSAADLSKLAQSLIRRVDMIADPIRLRIELEASDEMRYVLLITPQYQVTSSPTAVTVTTGLNLNFTEEKDSHES